MNALSSEISPSPTSRFTEEHTSGHARTGMFTTAHGTFPTPNFMPVGTKASVKGVDVERLADAGAHIMLVNTYHLSLRPGSQRVRELGGIHRFSGWNGPILSDSGGFQVFSLKTLRTITEQGVTFRSHLDGSLQFLSPERSIQIQEELGVDIAMAFDECPAGDLAREAISRSLDLTVRWAKRSLDARTRSDMSVFGITQGGGFQDLRTRSAAEISALPFDGFAIGGLSVGEPKEVMYEVLSYHPQQLPSRKIRYLMGVGTPGDIVEAVSHGVDLFDCVMPTRAGRFGRAFVRGTPPFINVKNSQWSTSTEPLDDQCSCIACRRYTKGYLHHLFKTGEMLGPQLLSVHNLTHYLTLMSKIRDSIRAGTFGDLHRAEGARWSGVTV